MKKYLIIFLLLSTIAYAAVVSVSKLEQCENKVVNYIEEVPNYVNVTRHRTVFIEEEVYYPENDTNGIETIANHSEEFLVEIKDGIKQIIKQKTECVDASELEVTVGAKTTVIDYLSKDFECNENPGLITCDSKLDGNGDGVCNSGESCYFIEVEDNCIVVSQQNSLDADGDVIETTLDGECLKIYDDTSFKREWQLLRGDSQ